MNQSTVVRAWIDFLLAQGAWLVAVLGASAGRMQLASFAALAVLLFHLVVPHPTVSRRYTIGAAGLVAIAGALVDYLWCQLGLIRFTHEASSLELATWLLALWFTFATTLPTSLSFLASRTWLATLLGAVCGPVAWIAGERLGAVSFHPEPMRSVVVLGAAWAIGFPWMLRLTVPRGRGR